MTPNTTDSGFSVPDAQGDPPSPSGTRPTSHRQVPGTPRTPEVYSRGRTPGSLSRTGSLCASPPPPSGCRVRRVLWEEGEGDVLGEDVGVGGGTGIRGTIPSGDEPLRGPAGPLHSSGYYPTLNVGARTVLHRVRVATVPTPSPLYAQCRGPS